MVLALTTSQPSQERFVLQSNTGTAVPVLVQDVPSTADGVAPFVGQYYVNQAFAGVQTGSASNPFKSCAAAFAFAASIGVTDGVVLLNSALTENVVFPLTGNWSLESINSATPSAVVVTGTIDLTCSVQRRVGLKHLTVTGNVTGDAPTATVPRARFEDCFLNGSVSLTGTGTGFWRASFCGVGANAVNSLFGFVNLSTTINGQIVANNFTFGPITITASGGPAQQHFFLDTLHVGTITTNVNSSVIFMDGCQFNAGQTFIAGGGTTLLFLPDAATISQLFREVPVFTGSIILQTQSGNGVPTAQTLAANSGAFFLTTVGPPGQMIFTCSLTLLVPGTLGLALVTVVYTDLLGVLRSKALPNTLNVAGAAGDEVSNQFIFNTNGASGVQFNVSGITTPGPLSYHVSGNVQAAY